jgi:hypothetical protein
MNGVYTFKWNSFVGWDLFIKRMPKEKPHSLGEWGLEIEG